MKVEEFEKLIVCEKLAQTNDTQTIMCKAYLDMPLRGGQMRAPVRFYAVGKITGPRIHALFAKIHPLLHDLQSRIHPDKV